LSGFDLNVACVIVVTVPSESLAISTMASSSLRVLQENF
jgi:hypothetical protein